MLDCAVTLPTPKGGGFSARSRRATCGVSARTTAPRAQILDLLWQGTTWEHRTMVTETQDIHRTDGVTRASGSTVRTVVYPAVLAPLPAYGTRLRGIGFINDNRASRLVVELLDELACASSAHLLGLYPSGALRRIVEWLTHVARGTRKRLSNRVGGLMRGVPYLTLRLVEHLILAALQPLPAQRAIGLCGLGLLEAGQCLVTPLDDGLDAAPTHEKHLGAIGCSNERVHTQVHADDSLLGMRRVGHLTGEAHNTERQPHLHQAPRQCHAFRQPDAQRPAGALGQDQSSVADTRILIGVHDIMVMWLAPRISCFRLSVLAQFAARVHCLAELTDDLLGGLRGDAGIPPLRPPLPACLGWPLLAETTNAMMTSHKVTPQSRRLFAASGEGVLFGCRAWSPRNFYRAIAHANSIANTRSNVEYRRLAAARLSPPWVKPGTLSREVW